MAYGPCGGVRADLSCELGDRPCPFATRPPVLWAGPPVEPVPAQVPLVLTDLTVAPYDPASVRRVVPVLAPVSDGLLVGEHHDRPDLPPTLFAAEVLAAGGRPWTTLTCRDRNRVVLGPAGPEAAGRGRAVRAQPRRQPPARDHRARTTGPGTGGISRTSGTAASPRGCPPSPAAGRSRCGP